jgi:hypothetical protein
MNNKQTTVIVICVVFSIVIVLLYVNRHTHPDLSKVDVMALQTYVQYGQEKIPVQYGQEKIPAQRVDSLREESPREESPHAESSREESPHAESSREESPRAESSREESPRAESSREESPRAEFTAKAERIQVKRSRESVGERKCREVLEKHYNKTFIKTRKLPFLLNPETNRYLELDCYNNDLKIAVEYNGIQHYVHPNYTKQTLEQFLDQHRRDAFKREQCDENGIYLIIVPYTVKTSHIEKFILDRLPETYPQTPRMAEMETFEFSM